MAAPRWRLVISGPVQGAMNMALDRAVLACKAAGSAPSTLRLYEWEVPTVSLGRFQPLEQVDVGACQRRGFDIVRRPTGGRGVLHDDEVTYSVVAGIADGVPRGVAASYRHLSAALAEAYRTLGVVAELTERQRGRAGSGACYLHATQADLSLGAAKLSGSAQVWKDDAVLQHGCFVVARDIEAESEVFLLDAAGRGELARTTATLSGALDRAPSRDAVVDAVVHAFGHVLGVSLEPGDFSAQEREMAEAWVSEHAIATARRDA
jgi:lipoate-protein ligase A